MGRAGDGMRNQIVGLVRFSYAALNGFTKAPADMAALEAQLYDPERLARRFHLFERLMMPSLLAQEDGDFQTVFLTGTSLPKAARERLAAAVAPLRGAMIVELEPMAHYTATQHAFAAALRDDATHLTSFRLDDDDAFDRRYIRRLRRMSAQSADVFGADAPQVVSGNRGFFLEIDPAGNRIFDVVEKAPPGSGPAMIAPAASGENIFRRNHRLLQQFFNTLTDVDSPSFIRTVHRDNDSVPQASGLIGKRPDAANEAALERHFPFTAAELKTL